MYILYILLKILNKSTLDFALDNIVSVLKMQYNRWISTKKDIMDNPKIFLIFKNQKAN